MKPDGMNQGNVAEVSEGTFDTEVLTSEIPVLVDFYANWCGPCKMVAPTFEALSSEYAGRVKFVKINVDLNQELSSRYGVMSIPTAMLFDKGSLRDSVIGAYPEAAYRERLDRALSA